MVKKGKGKKGSRQPTKSGGRSAKQSVKRKNPAQEWKKKHPHLFSEIHKDYSIGQCIQPRRDLSRMVKWPRYIRIQRQKKILRQRLKIPPPINQFTKTVDKNAASLLFQLLFKYRPETRQQKNKRLKKAAELQAKGTEAPKTAKPVVVKYGLNHVTTLIEQKEARLVIIAHDVEPIELVMWMPALCKKMGVPYCIVKSKARLGSVVHMKTAACLAITHVHKEDQHKLDQMVGTYITMFLDTYESERKKWGGGVLGYKALAALRIKEKAAQKELKKMGHLLS